MPDVSITETILGALAAIGVGTGGTAIAVSRRRPQPGTPEDLEQRVEALEAHRTVSEQRMAVLEERIAQSFDHLADSAALVRNVLDRIIEKIDRLTSTVIRLDVENGIERDIRRSSKEIPR